MRPWGDKIRCPRGYLLIRRWLQVILCTSTREGPKPLRKCFIMPLCLNTTSMKNMRNSCLLYVLLSFQVAGAQTNPVPFDLPRYNFIRYNINEFELIHDNPSYIKLFAKFDTLIKTGRNTIS